MVFYCGCSPPALCFSLNFCGGCTQKGVPKEDWVHGQTLLSIFCTLIVSIFELKLVLQLQKRISQGWFDQMKIWTIYKLFDTGGSYETWINCMDMPWICYWTKNVEKMASHQILSLSWGYGKDDSNWATNHQKSWCLHNPKKYLK